MEMKSLLNWLKENGTLTIAIYGVLQVWLIALWKFFFKKGKIEIHPNPEIEIGYSEFGPTVGVYGSLLSIHRETFVRNIFMTVCRDRDGAHHNFEWCAFRSNQIHIGSNQNQPIELPSGFMITPANPYRYNILFSDRRRAQEMSPIMSEIANVWADLSRLPESNNDSQLFHQMIKDGRITTQWDVIRRLCYWDAGEYSFSLEVHALHPSRKSTLKGRFSLNQEQAERLRLNTYGIVATMCNRPNVIYNFVFPKRLPLK